jgi:hypothetical protein
MLAHIAGIPVEETALGFAPIATVACTLTAMRLRRLAKRLPSQVRRESAAVPNGRPR